MSWWREPASPTQITHGARLWLYALAALVLVFLVVPTLIVFIICLGFYVTPAVLGGGKVILVSNQIANDIELFFNWGAASALGVVLLALTLLILWAASRLTRLDHMLGEGRR